MTLSQDEAEIIRTMRGTKYHTIIIKAKDGKPTWLEVQKGIKLGATG